MQQRRTILDELNHWRLLAPVIDVLIKLDRAKPLILPVDEIAVLQDIFCPEQFTPKEGLVS